MCTWVSSVPVCSKDMLGRSLHLQELLDQFQPYATVTTSYHHRLGQGHGEGDIVWKYILPWVIISSTNMEVTSLILSWQGLRVKYGLNAFLFHLFNLFVCLFVCYNIQIKYTNTRRVQKISTLGLYHSGNVSIGLVCTVWVRCFPIFIIIQSSLPFDIFVYAFLVVEGLFKLKDIFLHEY